MFIDATNGLCDVIFSHARQTSNSFPELERGLNYLIRTNFRGHLISRIWNTNISRALIFAILQKMINLGHLISRKLTKDRLRKPFFIETSILSTWYKTSLDCNHMFSVTITANNEIEATVTYSFLCAIRRFHVYKEVWKPILRERLNLSHERENLHDRYAI